MSDDEATTNGAADFDDFKTYFIRLVVLTVWIAYAAPIFGNLLDDKPLDLQSKLRTGWNYIRGQGQKAINMKKSQ